MNGLVAYLLGWFTVIGLMLIVGKIMEIIGVYNAKKS